MSPNSELGEWVMGKGFAEDRQGKRRSLGRFALKRCGGCAVPEVLGDGRGIGEPEGHRTNQRLPDPTSSPAALVLHGRVTRSSPDFHAAMACGEFTQHVR